MRFIRGRGRRGIVAAAVVVCIGAIQLVSAGSSSGVVVSQATGQFLTGTVGATSLGSIAALAPASAQQPAGPASSVDPLSATVLNAVNVDLGGGVHLLGGSGVMSLGAVNQVAVANTDGSSSAGSGAVDNTGAISAGAAGTSPSNATITLTPVLAQAGAAVTTALSAASLTTGALSAHATQAAGNGGAQAGTYNIASLNLTATSPLIAAVGTTLQTALGATGTLQNDVNGLTALIKAIPAIGALATVTGLPNLSAVLSTAIGTGAVSAAGGDITANLLTGAITINIGDLLGINSLAPNTDLVPLITAALTNDLLPAITTLLNSVTTALTAAFNGIVVSLPVLGPVLASVYSAVVAPVLADATAAVTTAVNDATNVAIPELDTGLSDLLALRVNGQAVNAGMFTETALRVGIVPAGPLATVQLANASVGPNAGPQPPTITGINPNTGPTTGGQGVTVTGTGFVTAGTSITIGGITIPAAQVTVASPTSLTFVTPVHAVGAVNVTATTTYGTSAPLGYTYVTTPAGTIAPPVITSPANGSTTTDPHVTISGTGIAADTVDVSEGTTATCSGVVGSGGTWTCTPATAFSLGAHTISATQTDGTSVSAASAAVTFTVVSSPSIAAPVITSPQNGSTVTDPKTPISGSGIAGDTVTVVEGSTTVCTALVASNGTWTCVPTTGFSLGAHTIDATQTDGTSVSVPSADVTFTVVDPASLPNTGADPSAGLLIAIILLGGGGLCLLAARRLRPLPAQPQIASAGRQCVPPLQPSRPAAELKGYEPSKSNRSVRIRPNPPSLVAPDHPHLHAGWRALRWWSGSGGEQLAGGT